MGRDLRETFKNFIPRRLVQRSLAADPERKRLLLTFDDGPHPTVTSEVLSRLDTCGARGLFFMCGRQVEAHPDVARRVLKSGHMIGNHTYSHQTPCPGYRAYLGDLRRCQEAFSRHLGIVPRFFRPARGRLSVTTLSAPLALGLQTIHWSLNVRDWSCTTSQEALAAGARLLRDAVPGGILVLHDDHEMVLPLLDFALPRLVDAGFDLGISMDEV